MRNAIAVLAAVIAGGGTSFDAGSLPVPPNYSCVYGTAAKGPSAALNLWLFFPAANPIWCSDDRRGAATGDPNATVNEEPPGL